MLLQLVLTAEISNLSTLIRKCLAFLSRITVLKQECSANFGEITMRTKAKIIRCYNTYQVSFSIL